MSDAIRIVHVVDGCPAEFPLTDAARALDRARTGPRADSLVIHVPGALAPHATHALAARLAPVYEAAGACPFFVDWQANPIEAVVDNLAAIAGEGLYRAIVKRAVKCARAKIAACQSTGGGPGPGIDDGEVETELDRLRGGDEPYAWLHADLPAAAVLSATEEERYRRELAQDPDFDRAVSEIVAMAARTDQGPAGWDYYEIAHLAPDVVADVRHGIPDAAPAGMLLPGRLVTGALAILRRTIRRFATGRGHGVYPTVVEEVLREFYAAAVLKPLWAIVKQRALGAFGSDGGASIFMAELARQEPPEWRPRVTLVAHGAGSIAACHWLRAAAGQAADTARVDLVLLAPACTTALMAATIAHAGSRIGGIRQFGLSDAVECRDALVPGVYPRSLLYLVSGVLEAEADTPLLGMERFFRDPRRQIDADRAPLAAVESFFADRQSPLVWSVADEGGGGASAAGRHDGFDRDAATLASVSHLLRRGFDA